MRIQSGVPNYLTSAQNPRTASRTTGSSFCQQLDIAVSRSGDRCEINYPKNRIKPDSEWELSPYVNLMAAHDQWKEQQPPQELPDSQGWTEENIAYLRERYSGSLSWEERVDMLETMKDMGMITREQWNSAYGDSLITERFDSTTGRFVLQPEMEAKLEAFRRSHPWNQDWNVYFQVDPISSFQTADDVLAWMAQPEGGSTGAAQTSQSVSRSTAGNNGLTTGLSPYVRLMNSYENWKAQQPPLDLPDSSGSTEELLAWLKEHYTGDLSWEERIDALNTAMDLGVITRDQRNEALGGGMVTFSSLDAVKVQFMAWTVGKQITNPAFFSDDWDVNLAHFTASKFKTADDFFAWLDAILARDSGDDDIPTEEAPKVELSAGETTQAE